MDLEDLPFGATGILERTDRHENGSTENRKQDRCFQCKLTAYSVVVFELLAIAYIRYRWMKSPLGQTIGQVIVGGDIVFALGIWLGRLGAS